MTGAAYARNQFAARRVIAARFNCKILGDAAVNLTKVI